MLAKEVFVMASTLDYLRWRGDLTFSERRFNSLDASLFVLLGSICHIIAVWDVLMEYAR